MDKTHDKHGCSFANAMIDTGALYISLGLFSLLLNADILLLLLLLEDDILVLLDVEMLVLLASELVSICMLVDADTESIGGREKGERKGGGGGALNALRRWKRAARVVLVCMLVWIPLTIPCDCFDKSNSSL